MRRAKLKDAYERMRQINVDYSEPNMPGQGPEAGPHPVMPPYFRFYVPSLPAL